MGTALNTVGVNASVDDGGQIVRWFDKEAAFHVLGGSWFEIVRGSGQRVAWALDEAATNAPRYRWWTDGGVAAKTVAAHSRALQVEIRGGEVPLVTVVDLVVGRDDELEVLESGLVVRRSRAVVAVDWTASTWWSERAASRLRLEVPVDSELTLTVSVVDRFD